MIIKYIFKIIPVFIFFTDKMVSSEKRYRVFGPIVIMNLENENNDAVMSHALYAVKTMFTTLWLNRLRLVIDSKYRLQLELNAYLDYMIGEEFNIGAKSHVAKLIYNTIDIDIPRNELTSLVHKFYNEMSKK